MAERAYAQQAESGAGAEGAADAGAEANTNNDDVVDAEFEEVKDDNAK